jgi:hypothetical protein
MLAAVRFIKRSVGYRTPLVLGHSGYSFYRRYGIWSKLIFFSQPHKNALGRFEDVSHYSHLVVPFKDIRLLLEEALV